MKLLTLAALALALPPQADSREPLGVADLYRAGEEEVWVFELDGKRLGYHEFRCEGALDLGSASTHRFTARVELDAMPALGVPRQRYLGELFTDEHGRPVRHVLEAELGETYSRVEMSIAGPKTDVVIEQGGSPRKLSVDTPKDSYLQANNFIGYYELMLAFADFGANDEADATLFSTNALKGVPVHLKRKERFDEKSGAKVAGWRIEDSLGQTITVADSGRILVIEIPSQKLAIRRSDERPESFTLQRAKDVPAREDMDVEVVTIQSGTIQSGKVALAGEITRRKDLSKDKSRRLPAIFFISGSGPQDRDGLSAGIDLGTHEILDRLTREGFLVLRVDDRGTGGSQGTLEGIGYDDLVGDARVCVDFLLAREDVDPDRIAVIGHSEGGITAPILAAERPHLAAVVLMAATGRPISDVILEQNAQALDLAGVTGEERKHTLEEVRRWLDLASSDAKIDPKDMDPQLRPLFAARAWLQGHAREDPIANVKKIRAPVLILQGSKDFQVSPERDARALNAALDEAKHADHRLVVLEGLDHLFKKTPGARSQLSDYFEKRPVDPGFLDALASWLDERLKPEKPR